MTASVHVCVCVCREIWLRCIQFNRCKQKRRQHPYSATEACQRFLCSPSANCIFKMQNECIFQFLFVVDILRNVFFFCFFLQLFINIYMYFRLSFFCYTLFFMDILCIFLQLSFACLHVLYAVLQCIRFFFLFFFSFFRFVCLFVYQKIAFIVQKLHSNFIRFHLQAKLSVDMFACVELFINTYIICMPTKNNLFMRICEWLYMHIIGSAFRCIWCIFGIFFLMFLLQRTPKAGWIF